MVPNGNSNEYVVVYYDSTDIIKLKAEKDTVEIKDKEIVEE